MHEADDADAGFEIGSSMDLKGTTMIVGAPGAESLSNPVRNHGAAYVFDLENGSWEQSAKLNPSTNAGGQNDLDRCGESVAFAGDYYLVGCPQDDTQGKTKSCSYRMSYPTTSQSLLPFHVYYQETTMALCTSSSVKQVQIITSPIKRCFLLAQVEHNRLSLDGQLLSMTSSQLLLARDQLR